ESLFALRRRTLSERQRRAGLPRSGPVRQTRRRGRVAEFRAPGVPATTRRLRAVSVRPRSDSQLRRRQRVDSRKREPTMKTFLVTGGAGFIGSNFVHHVYNKYPDA